MKNQTIKTQQLAVKFPYIVAYGTFLGLPTHEIVQQLWKADYFNAHSDVISISKINDQPVVLTLNSIADDTIVNALISLAINQTETVDTPKIISRKQTSIALEFEVDNFASEVDFSELASN